MKVGEFLELCMRYDEKMNLLNWQNLFRPVSIFRSTFDLNLGVQNRMHTTKIAVISSEKDWISSAEEYESNWYCLNQRLWDVGVRNGDLIEYNNGDQPQAVLSSRIRKYKIHKECRNSKKGHRTCFVKENGRHHLTIPKGKLKCWQVNLPEDVAFLDLKPLEFNREKK